MSFTYAELKTAIQDFTENTESSFVSNIPLFIRIAEERILKIVQLDLFKKNATASFTANNEYLALPSDFLAPFSLSYTYNGSTRFMEFKDVSFVQEYSQYHAQASSVSAREYSGLPEYYAVFDIANMIISPVSDIAYPVELNYFYRPASLTVGAESAKTWLSENAELTLLYGALIEAYIFMKGEADVMSMYEKRYQESLIGLKLLGEAKETTQNYRVGRVIREKQ